jgi:hypothetical protein
VTTATEQGSGSGGESEGPGGPVEARVIAYRQAERWPARRRLQIYSFDPMLAQTLERVGPARVTVSVPYEPLEAGPSGARVQVVDFDGGRLENGESYPCFYEPVDLENRLLALQDGLAPTEADPRFHQQMTYAVAMRVFEGFDRGLGRRLRPRRRRLRIFPHAFRGRNAFYHPKLGALLFGYFEAEREGQGPNLPGQMTYTCLSHDIVAHETTHALVDRLRSGFMDGTNEDVAAFHEAFADIVAIFLHFTLPGLLEDTIAKTRAELSDPTPLVQLAQQFGYATGRAGALRSAIDRPDPASYANTYEPHDRGSILVAAVFEAFLGTYRRRIADLLRLATGGSGVLPPGALHPDLVNRVGREASRTATQILNMCIRAFDYLPPVDVTFGDFLRAIVTADRELYPDDADGLRTALVDAFRRRGIYPSGVISLADDALVWEEREVTEALPRVAEWFWAHAKALDARTTVDPEALGGEGGTEGPSDGEESIETDREAWAAELAKFARVHAGDLDLDPNLPIRLGGFHPTFLADAAGAPRVSFVVQFLQRSQGEEDTPPSLLRRGTTIVADSLGRVRYVVSKPLPATGLSARATAVAAEREERFRTFLIDWEGRDPTAPFTIRSKGANPLRINFARLDGGWWR